MTMLTIREQASKPGDQRSHHTSLVKIQPDLRTETSTFASNEYDCDETCQSDLPHGKRTQTRFHDGKESIMTDDE